MKRNLPIQLISNLMFILISFSFSSQGYAQASSQNLSKEFLEGLPPSVRDEIQIQNEVKEEADLDALFRSDTSLEKNKVILNRIKAQLKAIEKRLTMDETVASQSLERFGENFFSSIQSSFMPINIPNFSSDYIVDVGDVFQLIQIGKVKATEELTVQRDGSLMIPGMGKVNVAGKSLANTEKAVNDYVASTAIGVTNFLTLSKVRDIQILILGGIVSPGIYTLSGGSTILGALNVAGGISQNGSFRQIDVRRLGQVIYSVDLYDIFITGNFSFQESLRSGDSIFVHPSSFQVPISGGVNRPGIFEVLPGEKLSDLVEHASGLHESFNGFNSINLVRNTIDDTNSQLIEVENLKEITLQPRDAVMVPSFKSEIQTSGSVSIGGEVNRPGEYFIEDGATLKSLIKRAGGYKKSAYIYGAALFRKDALEKEREFAQLNYADTVNYIVSNIGKPNSSINSSALDLLTEELRSKSFSGRVIADFDLSSQGSIDTIVLEDGDILVIPPLQKLVYTFGDFKNPSNIAYSPSKNLSDYVNLSGGLKESAYKELIIIDPDGKTHLYKQNILFGKNDIEIYPGSIIYASRDIGKLSGVMYASTVSPILSSLALSLASLNSIRN
ncbi:SLBB domain-containing protein [Pseudomonadota bacterium]|nr:SLBB domain-containing protein [Pseudomonadota bacterium]